MIMMANTIMTTMNRLLRRLLFLAASLNSLSHTWEQNFWSNGTAASHIAQ